MLHCLPLRSAIALLCWAAMVPSQTSAAGSGILYESHQAPAIPLKLTELVASRCPTVHCCHSEIHNCCSMNQLQYSSSDIWKYGGLDKRFCHLPGNPIESLSRCPAAKPELHVSGHWSRCTIDSCYNLSWYEPGVSRRHLQIDYAKRLERYLGTIIS